MAVKDDGLSYLTETIVSKKARKHYRVPVRSPHWQLRSLLSAENRHIVYFPGGSGSRHVQRLNTQTRDCETVKFLNFVPRCLVARGSWLCCGGEHGEFVAIRLEDDAPVDSPDSFNDVGPESRLPGTSNSDEEYTSNLLSRIRRSNKDFVAKNAKLAEDRVNCITLWSPPTDLVASDRAYNFPVAVLANNDKTVTLVELEGSEDNEKVEPLEIILYPDFVNRAVISPDGRFLIAVLDDPYLYVHERVKRAPDVASRSQGSHEYRWEEKRTMLLKSQVKGDKSDSRGSFAACFSSSGAYLAVGTQHGTISVFDVSLLTDLQADPLITTFKSSRPESGPGAVRDMSFCPGPFDILAWTEDRGRVGLADVRTNFVVRQVVDINDESEFEHINILDRNTVDPRLLDRRERREYTQGVGSSARGSPSSGENWRRSSGGLDALNHPLTPSETMVLEAIQGDRRRRDRINPRGSEEYSATRPARDARLARHTQAEGDNGGSRERSSSIGDLLGNYRDQRAHERVRSARQLLRDASERQQPTRRSEQAWMERIGETVAAMRNSQRDRQDPSYLSVLEILQARERGSNDPESEEAALAMPLVNRMTGSGWEESAIRGTLPVQDSFGVTPSPDNTAGLAWSEDGRILYVGAQNGIYELHINVQSRKVFPSITLR